MTYNAVVHAKAIDLTRACIEMTAAADLGIRIGRDPNDRAPTRYEDALTSRQIDSPIEGHPNPAEEFPFFPAATGSLGQVLSVCAWLALGATLDELDTRYFCLIGDGESREGPIWEAVVFIVENQLYSVCPAFNCNAYGQTARVSNQQPVQRKADRLEAAGMQVRQIDGHAPEAIRSTLEQYVDTADRTGRPLAIVASTIKG